MSSNTSVYLDYGFVLTNQDQTTLQLLAGRYPSEDYPGEFSLNAIDNGIEMNWLLFTQAYPGLVNYAVSDSSSGEMPGIVIGLASRHKEVWDKYAGLDGADFTIIEPKHDDITDLAVLKRFRQDFNLDQKPRAVVWTCYG